MALTRDQLQASAVEAVIKDGFVMVNWGTGVGKSRVAIDAIDKLFAAGAQDVLLLVDQSIHKTNWLNEFIDAKGEDRGRMLYDSVTVECYASLPKYAGTAWDLVVADEAHHLRSENRVGLLSSLTMRRILCLSATISCKGDAEELLDALSAFGTFRQFDFGLQKAIDNNILPEPTVHVHVLPLKSLGMRHLITEEWGPKARRKTVDTDYASYRQYLNRDQYPALTLNIDCSVAEANEYYEKQLDDRARRLKDLKKKAESDGSVPEVQLATAQNRVVRYGLLRKNLIGAAKTQFMRWLLTKMEGKRFICFCSDVDQAWELGGDNVICNEVKDSGAVVDSFNAGERSSLFAVNMGKEGQNLAGIEACIVIQLAGKDRHFIQEMGRAMRAKKPEQHIVVVDGTKDVEYLRESIASINPKYLRIHGYGEYKDKKLTLADLHSTKDVQKKEQAQRGAAIFKGLS